MFSRSVMADAEGACEDPCVTARLRHDVLSETVAQRIESFTGRPEPTTGLPATDGQPALLDADSSSCEKRALTIGPTLRRFNRYREALPYARAANDVSSRLGPGRTRRTSPSRRAA